MSLSPGLVKTIETNDPISFISSGPMDLVVIAGVPTRIPEALPGGSGSKGIEFLLTVIPARSSTS